MMVMVKIGVIVVGIYTDLLVANLDPVHGVHDTVTLLALLLLGLDQGTRVVLVLLGAAPQQDIL